MPSSKRFRFPSRLRTAASGALGRWARRRQGEDTPPVHLKSRRIYILPTKTGIGSAAALFLMLLGGLNYNNSLALILCFTLCGVVMVSMHECQRMLAGLRLLRAHADAAFSEQQGLLVLQFDCTDTRTRFGLLIRCAPCEASEFEVIPGSLREVRLRYQAGARGRQRIERLELSTSAPLGLFRAWTWLHVPLTAIIYPAPVGSLPLPSAGADLGSANQRQRSSGEEEWAWLRPFQISDPPRSVAWKTFARGGPMMVAHYDAAGGRHRLLDYALLSALPLERRLSQLSQWVLDSERLGESYALQLPQCTLPARHGIGQRRQCLEALAVFGL